VVLEKTVVANPEEKNTGPQRKLDIQQFDELEGLKSVQNGLIDGVSLEGLKAQTEPRSSKGPGLKMDSPSPKRYVGSWDPIQKKMVYQVLTAGEVEVKLEKDPRTNTYHPRVVSGNAARMELSHVGLPVSTPLAQQELPLAALLSSSKVRKSSSSTPAHSQRVPSTKSRAGTWKKRARGALSDGGQTVEGSGGEILVESEELAFFREPVASKRGQASLISSPHHAGIQAETVAQPRPSP